MKNLKLFIIVSGILVLTNLSGFTQSFNWQWAHNFGGQFNDYCTGSTTDSDGNIVVTGSFKSSSFDMGSFTLTNTSPANYDFFVAKISPDGNTIWAVSAGSDNSDLATEVAVSSDGSTFIGGHFMSSMLIIGSDTLVNSSLAGMPDLFVAKLDSDGNFVAATSSKGDFTEMIRGVAADGLGNIYIGGDFMSGVMVLGNDTLVNNGIMNVFLAKLDTDLNVSWTKAVGGESSDIICDVQTDNNNVFISGCYHSQNFYFDTIHFSGNGSGFENAYVFKCSPDGGLIWSFIPVNSGVHSTCERIAPAGDGNVYLAGRFKGNEFIIGSDTLVHNDDDFDFWIAKYAADHSLIWTKSLGSDLMDYINEMTACYDNGFLLAGEFSGDSMTVGNDTLFNSNPEIAMAFIAQFDPEGTALSATGFEGNGTNQITSMVKTDADGIFVSGIFDSDSLTFGNHTIFNAGDYDFFCVSFDFSTTRIPSREDEQDITVYPNPVHDHLYIFDPENQGDPLTIKLFDCSGLLIRIEKPAAVNGKYNLDVSDLDLGIYFLTLETAGKLPETEKIVVY